jgi:POT family proton-dependent oligopeptide transporter
MSKPLAQRTFLGHPLGLYVLFFTEMWERFSYYGMRALLILYMTQYFRWSQQDASTIYKVYTSFVYVTPIIGGFLADRYLGNRWAVIIGGVLMAIGHFLMAFEEYPIFLTALILLILGNGFFKPNMSTQVGRLYPMGDGRKDAAYTIFYMGINLGAFLSPLACGWLKDNTVGGFHSGFTLAGIGMVIGLAIYLFGQPLIIEIPHDSEEKAKFDNGVNKSSTVSEGIQSTSPTGITSATGSTTATTAPQGTKGLTEAEAAQTPSVLGSLGELLPLVLYVVALGLMVYAPVYYLLKPAAAQASAFWDAIMIGIGGICLALVGLVCSEVKNGVRDRVFAILLVGVFVMFFWGAFEQAGNVFNLWAENNTNRFLWKPMAPLDVYPEVVEEKKAQGDETPSRPGLIERFSTMFVLKPAKDENPRTWGDYFEGFFNPVSTEAFQSINALAIFVIAPLFAAMWVWLDKKNMQPSIAMKMFLGLVLVAMSVVVMHEAARQEDKLTKVAFAGQLPAGLVEQDGAIGHMDRKGKFERFHAGRFKLVNGELNVNGVLPLTERDNILEATAPKAYREAVDELVQKSKEIDDQTKSVSVTLAELPAGFDWKFAGLKSNEVSFDAETKTLTAYAPLKTRETKAMLIAAAEPQFRESLVKLYVEAGNGRVSSWWLFWAYIFATLGELCLSPVGLSMVSKLAPAKYATMLMGVWLLTSAFGNFAAGASGELWGTIAPMTFFFWLATIVAVASAVLLLIVTLLRRMMHGVD